MIIDRNTVPERTADGKWLVNGVEFETNAKAWRYIDKMTKETTSRAEEVTDWLWRKQLDQ